LGYVLFYALALGGCILVGALLYLAAADLAPVPEGFPTRGPSPTPTPTITPTPTVTPTPTPAPFSIGIRNRTGDDEIGERVAAYLADAGYNVDGISSGSTTTAFGDPYHTKVCVDEFLGPRRRLAWDLCRILEIDCTLWVWVCGTGDAEVLLEVGSIREWDAWLSEHGY